MKVVHVIGSLAAGGAERSVLELVTELHRQGVDVLLIVLASSSEGFDEEARSGGVPTVFLPPLGRRAKVMAVRRLLRQHRPDVVHATLHHAVLVAGIASVGLRTSMVSSIVTAIPQGQRRQMVGRMGVQEWLLRSVRLAVGRWRVARFHAITTATADVAAQYRIIPTRRIRVVERGRDLRRLGRPSPERRARVRDSLDIGQQAPLVVVGARLSTEKNVPALIAAFAKVVERVPDAVLVLAGREADDRGAVLQALEPLSETGSVRLLGHRDDFPDLLAAADATALSSLVEGGAGVLIEAMALGVPIVSTRIDGLVSMLVHGENALVVPQGDIAAFSDALVRVLTDAELASRLSAAGRQTFEQRFTIEGSAARMTDLYRDAIDHSRSLRRWVRRSVRQN